MDDADDEQSHVGTCAARSLGRSAANSAEARSQARRARDMRPTSKRMGRKQMARRLCVCVRARLLARLRNLHPRLARRAPVSPAFRCAAEWVRRRRRNQRRVASTSGSARTNRKRGGGANGRNSITRSIIAAPAPERDPAPQITARRPTDAPTSAAADDDEIASRAQLPATSPRRP